MAADVIKHLVTQAFPLYDPKYTGGRSHRGKCRSRSRNKGCKLRDISLFCHCPKKVVYFTIKRYCGSGLEAIAIASAKIHAGIADCIIAGGTESMSLVPKTGYKNGIEF
ncbi:MAG: hypothetical protein U5N85_13985 [Arcicella sp.]|nr:hypothetical protein [Arcicella sp.]